MSHLETYARWALLFSAVLGACAGVAAAVIHG